MRRNNWLPDELIDVITIVHTITMLSKVVKTRPDLVFFGTVCCRATETSIAGVFGCNLMHTFFMPFQVIFGAKPIFPGTTRFLAEKRLGVSKLMLPGQFNQLEQAYYMILCTYRYSERFFDWLWHSGYPQAKIAAGGSVGSVVER